MTDFPQKELGPPPRLPENVGTWRWLNALWGFWQRQANSQKSATGLIDHGQLDGLTDDDHAQYPPITGTRDFTGTQGGIAAVATSDFPIKSQMDAADQALQDQITALPTTVNILKYADGSVPGGNTVAGTASETAFTSAYQIPANTLAVGKLIRVRLWGVYGTTLIAPTLRGRFKIDGVTVLDTGALSTVVSATDRGWSADIMGLVTTAGASGKVEIQGYASFATAASAALAVHTPTTAKADADTTQGVDLTVTVEWGTSDAANTITLRLMTVEILGPA